ncbi:MAG: hypothetical protein K0R51_825 [Cytophagaceae bacterium]|jgi:hypothetical protein|nr:hypothetical protein [Cytophagaceae bacterium]
MSKRKKKTIQQFPSRKFKKPVTKEGIRWKIHLALVIGFTILLLVHHHFIEKETIGHDIKYDLYIVWIPMLIGFIALIFYQWSFVKDLYLEIKGVKGFVLAFFVWPIAGLFVSYITIGNLANISWEYLNTKEAEQHMPKVMHCDVESFNERRGRGTGNSIGFTFNNRYETFETSYQYIKPYLSTNPDDYELEIVTQKGLWNFYVVKSWYLKKR